MNPEYLRYSANFGFYIIAFFLPISISITQLGLGLVLGSWALIMVEKRQFSFVETPLNKPIMFYLGGLILSALLGYNLSNSLISIRETWICLIFFSMMALIRDFKTVKRLVSLLLASSAIAGVYGIVQHLIGGLDLIRAPGKEVIQYAHLQYPQEVLAVGFFRHHLTYGEMILITLLFSLAYLLTTFSKSDEPQRGGEGLRVPLTLLVLVLGVALLYSFARSSWVGFVIAFFFMLLFFNRKTSIILVAVFIPSLLLTATFHPPTKERIVSIFSQKERLYIWRIAFEFAGEKPVTGIGLNNWQDFVDPKIDYYEDNNIFKFGDRGVTQHAHNSFLTHLAEGGIVGAGAFLYLFFVIYRDGVRNYSLLKSSRVKRGIVLGALTGITGFHGAGLFENTFGDSEILMLVWFVTGLMYLCFKLPETGSERALDSLTP